MSGPPRTCKKTVVWNCGTVWLFMWHTDQTLTCAFKSARRVYVNSAFQKRFKSHFRSDASTRVPCPRPTLRVARAPPTHTHEGPFNDTSSGTDVQRTVRITLQRTFRNGRSTDVQRTVRAHFGLSELFQIRLELLLRAYPVCVSGHVFKNPLQGSTGSLHFCHFGKCCVWFFFSKNLVGNFFLLDKLTKLRFFLSLSLSIEKSCKLFRVLGCF